MRLCTTNPGKIREFGGLLLPLGISILPSPEEDVPETGTSFSANAEEKVRGYGEIYPNEWILSEDSGLVIPALGIVPGVWSARFSDLNIETLVVTPSGRSREEMDKVNGDRVLDLMRDITSEKRGAYFVSHLILLSPEKEVAFRVEERAYGWIATEKRGQSGFGYDPLFISEGSFGKTWAEIDGARKSLISHRSKAVWAFMSWMCTQTKGVC